MAFVVFIVKCASLDVDQEMNGDMVATNPIKKWALPYFNQSPENLWYKKLYDDWG